MAGGTTAGDKAGSAGRDRWVHLVCIARVFLFANFMVVAATLPVIMAEWEIGAAQAGSIITSFTLAYAFSLFATAWMSDHFGARRVTVISGWLAAAAALCFALLARDFVSALLLYGLAGLMQGGTYTPIVMLFAERFEPARRGSAVGWLIGSTSLGYAGSLGAAGLGLWLGGLEGAFLATGMLPLAGALILTRVLRATPNTIHDRVASGSLRSALTASGDARKLIGGYTAHSWELLGMWAWAPAFFAANLVQNGWGAIAATGLGAYVSSAGHVAGAVASLTMGAASDRFGRRRVLIAVAGACALLSFAIGWLIALPSPVLAVLVLVYAFLAIGDSAVLSTALSEVVHPGVLGSVLAVRSLAGFGAGALAPLAFGLILDWSGGGAPGWGFAFAALGLGGALAAWCAIRLNMRG